MAGLEDRIARLIRAAGPIGVARYMAEALLDPVDGYYTRGTGIGRAGDFVTAPEISQMFGELVGLWLAQAWLDAGRPAPVRLVELGPGRGTLMADALRAAAAAPGSADAVRVHLVEASPVLRREQADRLAAARPAWHDRLADVPDGPLLLVANEFLDALPVHQYVRGSGGWHERRVGLDAGGRLAFVVSPGAVPLAAPSAPPGAVLELAPARDAQMAEIGRRIAGGGVAALVIDYGYEGPAIGDTLQALRGHAPHPVLATPGEADLTAHVDFAAAARAARTAGSAVHGPVGQGRFLEALGIAHRADRLAAANPARAGEFAEAVSRLTAADRMGDLFRVLAVLPGGSAPPPGFP